VVQGISNWGRWGTDDELGTLNLITPEKRKSAAALVRDGVSVSLALELNKTADALNTHSFEQTLTVGEFDVRQRRSWKSVHRRRPAAQTFRWVFKRS
jgi:hypothetical protein